MHHKMIQQSWGQKKELLTIHMIVGTTIRSFQGLLFSETVQNIKRPLYMKEVDYNQSPVYIQYAKHNVTQGLIFFFSSLLQHFEGKYRDIKVKK